MSRYIPKIARAEYEQLKDEIDFVIVFWQDVSAILADKEEWETFKFKEEVMGGDDMDSNQYENLEEDGKQKFWEIYDNHYTGGGWGFRWINHNSPWQMVYNLRNNMPLENKHCEPGMVWSYPLQKCVKGNCQSGDELIYDDNIGKCVKWEEGKDYFSPVTQQGGAAVAPGGDGGGGEIQTQQGGGGVAQPQPTQTQQGGGGVEKPQQNTPAIPKPQPLCGVQCLDYKSYIDKINGEGMEGFPTIQQLDDDKTPVQICKEMCARFQYRHEKECEILRQRVAHFMKKKGCPSKVIPLKPQTKQDYS